jgi:hypothetical protein
VANVVGYIIQDDAFTLTVYFSNDVDPLSAINASKFECSWYANTQGGTTFALVGDYGVRITYQRPILASEPLNILAGNGVAFVNAGPLVNASPYPFPPWGHIYVLAALGGDDNTVVLHLSDDVEFEMYNGGITNVTRAEDADAVSQTASNELQCVFADQAFEGDLITAVSTAIESSPSVEQPFSVDVVNV